MNKKIKAFLKYFFPPILSREHIFSIYDRIVYKNKIAHHFKFENSFFTRHAFINKAISKFKDCKYLEIGIDKNQVFNSVPLKIENKFGVDPVRGGNFRMTSDEFFEKNSHLKFDVIFIDGLHEYEQCRRDCLNSMRRLNKGGIIFLHDVLPRSFFEEKRPRKEIPVTGNVWKVAVELANSKNVEFKILNIDHGIGILKLKENFYYQKIDKLKRESFKEYLEYKKRLPIITCEEGLDFISEQ